MGRKLRETVEGNAWPVFASLSWAAVMWIFRWYPATIQPSLRSSMQYMYVIVSPSENAGEGCFPVPGDVPWCLLYHTGLTFGILQIRGLRSLGQFKKFLGI